MARFFVRVASEYLEIDSAVVSAPPFTGACWFNSNDVTVAQTLMFFGNKNVGNHHHALLAMGTVGGDPVRARSRDAAGAQDATTTAGYTANTWCHACGVWAATNDRRAYVHGANRGNNAVNRAPANLNRTSIGRLGDSTPAWYMSGAIGEAAVWAAALTDVEVWLHYQGRPPWEIRPDSLVGLWLPFGDRANWDYSGRGYHMTAFNTPTFAADPPKIVRAWRSNPQYIGRRIMGREQPGGVRARPIAGLRTPRPPAAYNTLAIY